MGVRGRVSEGPTSNAKGARDDDTRRDSNGPIGGSPRRRDRYTKRTGTNSVEPRRWSKTYERGNGARPFVYRERYTIRTGTNSVAPPRDRAEVSPRPYPRDE